MKRVISVFGSARPAPGSVAYQQAHMVGRLLAEAGLAVATGGYTGTMMAVSQGAAEAGGHVIGVTVRRMEQLWRGQANEWVAEEIKYETLPERLLHLVIHNAGMIALPGGVGTLSEWTLAWSLLQVGELGPRPFILLGSTWRQAVTDMADPAYVGAADMGLIQFADSPVAAVNLLRAGLG